MTEVSDAAYPELGAKSPEKTDKPRSAPREKKGDNRNNKKETKMPENETKNDSQPLVKPSLVPEPDQQAQDNADAKIRAQIDADEARVAELNEQIDRAREERGEHNEGMKAIKQELNDLRAKSRDVASERDALVDKLKKHSEQMRAQDQKLQKLRRDIKIMDSAGIDNAIAEMTHKLETSSMDIKSEKAILWEMKQMNTQKEQLKEWDAEKEKITAKKEEHEEMYKKRQEVGEKLNQMREQEKAVAARLDNMKAGQGTADGVAPSQKVQELSDQKQKIIDGMKAKRAEIKQNNVQFRIKMAEHREYQRALEAYERKVGRREYLERRHQQAERNAAMKDERKKRDQERKEDRARQEKRFAAVAAGYQMFVGGLALRTTDEDMLAYFSQFAEVTDCGLVKDNETKMSKGFGFVTVSSKEKADEIVKENNGKELKLCPPHGRMSVKMAAKSKLQLEWESKQKKRNEKYEEEKKGKGGKRKEEKEAAASEGKDQDEEGGHEDEQVAKGGDHDATVDDSAADDAIGACGVSDTVGDVEMPSKGEEKDEKENMNSDNTEGDASWKATRSEWVKDGKTNGPLNEEGSISAI